MGLEIIKASAFISNIKCSIHKNGKLGFSSSAIEKLNIDNTKSILFAKSDDEKEKGNLFIVIQDDINEDAFKVNRAGNYYYLNTKAMFDTLGYDYRSGKAIMFDIIESDDEYEGKKAYKLLKREGRSKENN